ncbi:MAG: hypothetical protein KBF49_09065, partial [Flavobacteriales bacterium]|nr:hypothetical protein [Flavobacteriales bacterium]
MYAIGEVMDRSISLTVSPIVCCSTVALFNLKFRPAHANTFAAHSPASVQHKILILDHGSQYTQLLARR